jgi:hypothetical protein
MNKTSFGHAVGIRRRVSFLSERNAARLSSGAVTQDSQGFATTDGSRVYRYGDSNPGLMAENHPS